MDNKDNKEKYSYKYELVILSVVILFIIILSKSKYKKKYLYKIVNIEEKYKDKGIHGYLIFIIFGIILNQALLFYPFINLSSGFIFGFYKGFAIAYIIVLISSIVSFYISRYIFKNKVTNTMKNNKSLNKIYELQYNFSFYDWIKYIILLRVSPISFNITNYLLGTTNVDIMTYIIGTSIGILPWLVLEIFTGTNIKSIHKLVKKF